jgi:hypothetical protein
MGLNELRSQQQEQSMAPSHKRIMDMTLWMAYVLDCQQAAVTGEPTCLQEGDITLPLPVVVSTNSTEVCRLL